MKISLMCERVCVCETMCVKAAIATPQGVSGLGGLREGQVYQLEL